MESDLEYAVIPEVRLIIIGFHRSGYELESDLGIG